MPSQHIAEAVDRAMRKFFARDLILLEIWANERSMTHKLAEYLQNEFPDWNVDCEYNRDGDVAKELPWSRRTARVDDVDAKTVFPDIIVHRRNTTENLLVIEAKKSGGNDSDDRSKISAFLGVLRYENAALIRFNCGDAPGLAIEWISE